MATVGDLTVRIGGNVAELQHALRQATTDLTAFGQRFKETQSGLLAPRALVTTSNAFRGVGQSAGGAASVLVDFGRAANDAQQFSFGFRQGLVAVSNQVDGLVMGFRQMVVQTGSVRSALGAVASSLLSPAGIVAGLNLAVTAVIIFGPKIAEAFDRAGAAARRAREDIRGALEDILTFDNAAQAGAQRATFAVRLAQAEAALQGGIL